MPHGMCLLWEPWLVILWAGSDLLIFLAYTTIPFALLQVLRRRGDIQHSSLVFLFASFILLCGITHALSILTLWVPVYPLHGFVKLATGVVSAATAFVLFRLIPALVAIPSPGRLDESNRQLRLEIASHDATLNDLRQLRDELEVKIAERTEELEHANAQLAVAAREAVHRSRNLISVVTAIARQSARDVADVKVFVATLIGRLNSLATATNSVIGTETHASATLNEVINAQLAPVIEAFQGRIQIAGPQLQIGAQAAQQISLALHELATNAYKYGALSRDDGQIGIEWLIENEDHNTPQLVLSWREETGKVSQSSSPTIAGGGFGTRLLNEIIPSMLSGEAHRKLENGNLHYELRVPLAAILPDTAA